MYTDWTFIMLWIAAEMYNMTKAFLLKQHTNLQVRLELLVLFCFFSSCVRFKVCFDCHLLTCTGAQLWAVIGQMFGYQSLQQCVRQMTDILSLLLNSADLKCAGLGLGGLANCLHWGHCGTHNCTAFAHKMRPQAQHEAVRTVCVLLLGRGARPVCPR